MRALFLSVLSLSISILPFLILLLILQNRLKQRFGTRWLRLIWVVVLVRLLLPFPVMGESLLTPNVFAPVLYDGTISEEVSVLFQQVAFIDCLAALWFVIAGAMLLEHVMDYHLFLYHVRRRSYMPQDSRYALALAKVREVWALPQSLRVMICPDMKTPAAVGVFRPVILLPSEQYDDSTMMLILHHEAAHLRRGDILVKWCAMLANCLYWFHPFVYLVQKELEQHLEIACDEAVMKKLGQETEIQKAYSYIILAAAAGKAGQAYPIVACLQDTKVYLKARIDNIFDTRPKRSGMPVLVLSAVALLLSSGLLQLEYYDTRSIELLPEVQYEVVAATEEQIGQSIVTVDLYRLEQQLEEQEA